MYPKKLRKQKSSNFTNPEPTVNRHIANDLGVKFAAFTAHICGSNPAHRVKNEDWSGLMRDQINRRIDGFLPM